MTSTDRCRHDAANRASLSAASPPVAGKVSSGRKCQVTEVHDARPIMGDSAPGSPRTVHQTSIPAPAVKPRPLTSTLFPRGRGGGGQSRTGRTFGVLPRRFRLEEHGGRRPGAGNVGSGGVRVPGGPPGLQNRWTARRVVGGFDSRPPPPRPGPYGGACRLPVRAVRHVSAGRRCVRRV